MSQQTDRRRNNEEVNIFANRVKVFSCRTDRRSDCRRRRTDRRSDCRRRRTDRRSDCRRRRSDFCCRRRNFCGGFFW